MERLIWGNTGDRFYEAGVDRGVLYIEGKPGVPWNGLIKVSESPSGGAITPYYIDGQKYLNEPDPEEFGFTIEAYTYPDEFSECDGSHSFFPGFSATQQDRAEFGLTYRTGLGNDLLGLDYGYKIHLVYGAMVSPSAREYSTLAGTDDASTFSWGATTTTERTTIKKQLFKYSHLVIDSTKTDARLIHIIEDYLYGSPVRIPSLITFQQLYDLYENPIALLRIIENYKTGISPLVGDEENNDLIGALNTGLFKESPNSRLVEKATEGLYGLNN